MIQLTIIDFILIAIFIYILYKGVLNIIEISRGEEERKEKEKNITDIIMQIIILGGVFWILHTTQGIFQIYSIIIKNNFGDTFFNTLKSNFIGAMFWLAFPFVAVFTVLKILKKHPNTWLIVTAYVMIFFFLIGIVLVNELTGNKELRFNLNDANNNDARIGKINCTSDEHKLLSDSIIYCNYEPRLDIYEVATVSFELENGTITPQEMGIDKFRINPLRFEAKPDVKKVNFKLIGNDSQSQKLHLTTGYKYNFPTLNEYNESKNKFTTYLIGLIGFILFSVPMSIVNIRKLSKPPKKYTKFEDFLSGKHPIKGIGKKTLEKIRDEIGDRN